MHRFELLHRGWTWRLGVIFRCG